SLEFWVLGFEFWVLRESVRLRAHLAERQPASHRAIRHEIGTPPRARRRPHPRKSGWFTIRITEQNNCGTIGLFSLQKTPAHRGRRTRTSPDFGVWVLELTSPQAWVQVPAVVRGPAGPTGSGTGRRPLQRRCFRLNLGRPVS